MKKLLWGAALFCAAIFSGCGDEYDDTALRNEVEGLKDRVAALEAKLTSEVNALKGLINALEEGLAVSVEETADGYDVTIGDETFTIYNGEDGTNGTDGADGTVITVVEVDGVYYWAINGEATDYPVTGNDGEDGEDGAPGQNGYTPEIKDGKWYINGEEVGPAVGENGEDGDSFFKSVVVNDDDTVTFTLNDEEGTTITVALAKSAKYTDVQSIKFVPEYEDGLATIGYATGASDAFIEAKYEVTPKAAAELIAKNVKDASMQAIYTKSRAEAGDVVDMPITSIEAENGFITVKASGKNLATEVFEGTQKVSVRFAIQDAASGNASGYVPAVTAEALIAKAAAQGWQGAKLTWNAFSKAATYKVSYGDFTSEAIEATEYVFAEESLNDATEYDITVTAYDAEGKEVGASEVNVQVWTLANWTEPQFELQVQEDGSYKFIAHNLANLNYAYGGMAATDSGKSTIEIYKDGELQYTLVNSTPAGTLKAWAGYKRWALGAMDDRYEWTWTGVNNSEKEVKTVPADWFTPGEYTIKYKIGYVVNKNGYWATGTDASKIVANREDGATVVFFSNGLSDVYCVDGNVAVKTMEGTSSQTFKIEYPYQLNAVAAIDNGTDEIRKLFAGWQDSWTTYGWYGKRSVNGQFESATLSWDAIDEADKVVIAYGDQTVEITDGMVFKTIEGIKTSPVEFTLTAYKGEAILSREKVTSDVYTLPETASGEFGATYSATNGGWTITGEHFNTNKYATWACSFNIYEKGSDTPVFETPITKHSNNDVPSYLGWISNNKVETSTSDHAAFKVDNGEWDQGKLFNGLKGETEYEVRFELSVFPFIYDAENAGNNENTFMYKKMLIGTDRSQAFSAQKLAGTYTFTTGEGPAEFEATAKAEGYQGANVQWNTLEGATGYEVYVGETKVAEAAADATSASVIGLTDATSYVFTVKALGVNRTTDTIETDVWTLANWTEPQFELKAVDDQYQFIAHNLVTLNYAYGGMTADGGMSTIEIYKDNALVYTLTNTTGEGTLSTWAGYKRWALNAQDDRKDWTWTDADGAVVSTKADGSAGEVSSVPASFFTPGDYTIEYKIGYVMQINATWATNANSTWYPQAEKAGATHVYFAGGKSDVYCVDGKVATMTKEGTASFTVAAPAINWDYVMGDYTQEEWESPYHLTNTTLWNGRGLGYYSGLKGVYKADELKNYEGTSMGTPKDGQKYAICYSYWNFICFDIDSTEINPETMQPQEGTGCYALINMIDRPTAIDTILENYSYYNKNEGAFYVSFLLRGIWDQNEDGSLKDGASDHEHTGKLHTRVDFAQ